MPSLIYISLLHDLHMFLEKPCVAGVDKAPVDRDRNLAQWNVMLHTDFVEHHG